MKIHIADGPLKCKECGKQFTTSGEMFTEKGGMGVGACMRVCERECVSLHIGVCFCIYDYICASECVCVCIRVLDSALFVQGT